MSYQPDPEILRETRAAVGLMLTAARHEGDTLEQLSKRAQLGQQTIANLSARRTRFPRHETILKLARATGFHYEVVRGVIRMSSARKAKARRSA